MRPLPAILTRLLTKMRYWQRNTSDFSSDAFDLTTQILTLNPEFQTAWAFRRRILQFNLATDACVLDRMWEDCNSRGTPRLTLDLTEMQRLGNVG